MLSKRERYVMEILWSSSEPLSCRELNKRANNMLWNESYIHNLINSLLRKKLIKVDDGIYGNSAKKRPRKFRPTMSKLQYVFNEYFDRKPDNRELKDIIQDAVLQIDNLKDLIAVELYISSRKIKYQNHD